MRADQNSQSLGFIVIAATLGLGSMYFVAFASSPKTATVLAAFAVASLMAAMMEPPRLPTIEVDDEGIYDPRLGIGKIFWKEVRDFYVEETHGNRFLCFKVERPERFMLQADRSQKKRMEIRHAIGFRRINVDVGHIGLSVQDLHQRIERRIERAP